MKLFGFNKKKKEVKFRITELDRNWVEDNFKWLIQVYGYPNRNDNQILLDEQSFPKTYKTQNVKIENLIEDLSSILNLDSNKINFEFQEDLRDSYGTPYEIHGKPFETETLITDIDYKIFIAKSLTNHPNRLIFSLIYEFIKIRLSESKLQYETGEDTGLFIYLAGIYLGFGVVLSQNLIEKGISNDGFMETKWSFVSEMPNEVMAFALATYSKLIDNENPVWKTQLPQELISFFNKSIDLINDSPSPLFSKQELEANDILNQADIEYKNGEYDIAISTLQKALFLTQDEYLKAHIYNNIGYYQIRKGDILRSVSSFQKSLEIDPDYGYANDNLGYAFIKLGELEKGKEYIERALETLNNDNAYSYRNLALYHQAKGQMELAERNFKKAFQKMVTPVDLLELHYGEFLLIQGKNKEGFEYIKQAVEKGEPEALKRIKELENN